MLLELDFCDSHSPHVKCLIPGVPRTFAQMGYSLAFFLLCLPLGSSCEQFCFIMCCHYIQPSNRGRKRDFKTERIAKSVKSLFPMHKESSVSPRNHVKTSTIVQHKGCSLTTREVAAKGCPWLISLIADLNASERPWIKGDWWYSWGWPLASTHTHTYMHLHTKIHKHAHTCKNKWVYH